MLRGFERKAIVLAIGVLLFAAGACNQSPDAQSTNKIEGDGMKLNIPRSITAEHEELHYELERAINTGGRTGAAAKIVAERLHSHFEKEEQYALPPLGLLSQLATGTVSPEMREAIALGEKLKTEMPMMLEEHKTIVEALNGLASAAKGENKQEAVAFTEKLKMHAQNEEEILYPAAILVGEHLKLRLKDK
jgi:hemerythrin-like domain-containing protein